MSAIAAAVAPLDDVRIRRLRNRVGRIRELLQEGLQLVQEVYHSDDWKLVASSWEEFCEAELPELALLGREPEKRRAAIVELAGRRLSQRAIAAPLGLSVGTVNAELKAAGIVRDKVKSRDGRIRPAEGVKQSVKAPRLTNVARAVLVIREAGDGGASVHELAKRLRLNQCATSALLSRLAADGRLEYRRPAKRGQTGRYVVAR